MAPADRAPLSLYGGKDPRDLPRYTYPEAERATGVPATTVAAWVRGQTYPRKHDEGFFEPVIQRPNVEDKRLSFFNLIEVHVLRHLRRNSDPVKLRTVREARDVAQARYGIDRLLIHEDLRWSAGELFLATLSDLEHLSRSQQLVMKEILHDSLRRITFAGDKLPTDFWPVERLTANVNKKLILVSPLIAFGRPIVKRVGVSTSAIAERVNAGETAEAIMADYRLDKAELEEALAYEAAA
jgi:uncharacterized protein (DUF433 family)